MARRLVWVLGVVLLAGCSGGLGEDAMEETIGRSPWPTREPPTAPEVVRFVAFGDAGFGNEAQRRLARAMESVCGRLGCDFALMLGDNIYMTGVDGPFDPQFVEKFERPYRNLSMPFYVVLGNHDVTRANPEGNDSGDFQVEYSTRPDRPSTKWTMPARSYSFTEGHAFFAAIDMTRYADAYDAPPEARASLAWLASETTSDAFSSATWRVAFSHFPYASNGDHGSAGKYDGEEGKGKAVEDVVEEGVCGRFDVYLSGHDHDMQWLMPRPECSGTELFVSGAGAEARSLDGDLPARFQRDEGPGFFWFELRGERMIVRAFDADGKLVFERGVFKAERSEGSSSLRTRDERP